MATLPKWWDVHWQIVEKPLPMEKLLQPKSGTIKLFDRPVGKTSHFVGYVPQEVSLNRGFPISVLDVVLMGKLSPGNRWTQNKKQNRRQAMEILDKLGMRGYSDRKIGELSGGERQRVLIARALATDPKLLLLDEPTANVDLEGQTELYKLLRELNKNITILVVSHEWVIISSYVKSVACVNKNLHYHHQSEIDREMTDILYPHSQRDVCPVEWVAHGIPHRGLKTHDESSDD